MNPDDRLRLSAALESELELLPKKLLLELSAKALGPFSIKMRAERNKFRGLYEQTKQNLDKAKSDLENARNGCRKLKEQLNATKDAQP